MTDLYQHGFNITYPTVRFGNTNGYIGGSLGGVSAAYGKADKMILASAKVGGRKKSPPLLWLWETPTGSVMDGE